MSLPAALKTKIKDTILGPEYQLSVAFVSKATIRHLNKTYRQLDEPTDVLSFPLSATEGELIFNRGMIAKKAPEFEKNYADYFLFLFIHGLLHLKGLDHGSTMEAEEARLLQLFLSHAPSHRRRPRHRKLRHQGGGRSRRAR